MAQPMENSNMLSLPQQTMTTREIAELTGKRHDNVMRDTRTMLTELYGDGGLLSFEDTYSNPQNRQPYPIFRLPKRETLILVSGYSLSMRAAIIDRWQELEQQAAAPQLPDFTNPATAARAWADQLEQAQIAQQQVQQLSAENAHLQAHFVEGIKPVDFARTLNGVNVQKIQLFLAELGWLRRGDGFSGWRVNSKVRDRYLAERTQVFKHPTSREEVERHYPVLLKAGAVRLFKLYTEQALPMKATWNGSIGHGKEVLV